MDGKQLKNSILQWAIQGKLVPQNPKDEPAQILLERIAASRNGDVSPWSEAIGSTACHPERNAVKSKDLKKKKPAPTSRIYRENGVWYEQAGNAEPKDISEDIPFEIPENWAWCRLGNVINLLSGRDFEPQFYNDKQNGIPYITGASNIGKNGIIINRWTPVPKCIANYGDLLLVCKGSGYGTLAYADFEKAHIARQIMSITVEPRSIFLKYVELVLQTNFQFLKGKGKGLIPGIDRETILNILAPLPPLAEQKRIVAKLEQVLPLADEYGAAQEQLDKLNKELPEALKKSILQQAIQGKLVPQNPKDEPAQILLERIAASRNGDVSPWSEAIGSSKNSKKSLSTSLRGAKATKQSKNPSSRIYRENGVWYEQVGTATPKDITDEIPFEIPETWAWCRMNTVCDIVRGGSPRPIQDYLTDSSDGYNWIKIGDTEKGGKYINSTKEKIKPEGLSKTRLIHKGDFLLTNSMSFGRPYISNIDGCIHDGWLALSILGEAFFPDYLYYLLSSQYAYKQFRGKVSGAVVKNLNIDKVEESLIPLPPLAEQKRIVAKIEQLFRVL